MSGRQYRQNVTGLTALSGGGQTGATLLSASISRVDTVAVAADSCILPTAAPGREVIVINAAAANAMNVYPAVNEFINALAVNTALSCAANTVTTFYCAKQGTWNSK